MHIWLILWAVLLVGAVTLTVRTFWLLLFRGDALAAFANQVVAFGCAVVGCLLAFSGMAR